MRIAFVGDGEVTVRTAELLIEKGHEVITIENNPEKIENVSDILDCSKSLRLFPWRLDSEALRLLQRRGDFHRGQREGKERRRSRSS